MVLKINGDIMPSPSKLYVVLADIRTEERNAAGATVIDRVAVKRRVECDWWHVTRHELAWLLEHTNETLFDLEYFDPLDNELRTIECTVGERSVGAIMYVDHIPMWGPIKMTFSER